MAFSAKSLKAAAAGCALAAASLCAAPALRAQVLARPGWAGSGVAVESWWRNGVFYRIDVRHFQDSDGDAVGDLRGAASRMDYLQSLGVDAVVLEQPFDDAGFDDLQREASRHHIRVIVELTGSASNTSSAASNTAGPAVAGTERLLGEARSWLTRGAAGLYLRTSTVPASSNPQAVIRQLRALTRSLPGDRILLAEPLPAATGHGDWSHDDGPQLVDTALAISARHTAASISSGTITFQSMGEAWPLLSAVPTAEGADPGLTTGANAEAWKKIVATVLLASRGAISLEYGQELGLENYPPDFTQTMRWTPSNRTDPNALPPDLAGQAPAPIVRSTPQQREDVYGAFVPYTPAPVQRPRTAAELAREKLDALTGFSTAAVPPPASQPEVRDAATQEADANSLLNYVRRLAELHHGNSSLRNGTPYVLDHDAEHALVLVRRAPAGARTAATVVVVCNMGSAPLHLSLASDFDRLRIRPGTLRPLIASWTDAPVAQNADAITLPAYGSFIGELYHDIVSGSAGSFHRHGRRQRPTSR